MRPSSIGRGSVFRVLALTLVLALVATACGDDESDETTTTTALGDQETTSTAEDNGDDGDEGDATTSTTAALEGEPVEGGTLVVGLDAETVGWDPPDGLIGYSGRIVNNGTYEALTAASKEGTYEPDLAESVTPNEDATVWTIVLREGISFQDGSPLNAEAVKYHMDRVLDPENSAIAPSFTAYSPVVEIVDDRTLTLTLSQPLSAIPTSLAGGLGQIVSMEAVESMGPDAFAEAPVGAGPYEFVEWVRDDHFTAQAWDEYWRDDIAHFNTVEYRPIVDDSARAAALRAGDIDVFWTQNSGVILEFRDDPEFKVFEFPFGANGLYLNHDVAPTSDIRFRTALAHAIDKQALIDLVWAGVGIPTNTMVPKDNFWYTPVETPEYDPDAARALVEEYIAEGNSAELDMIISPAPLNTDLAQALQAQLAEVGIQLTITEVDPSNYVTLLIEGDYQIASRAYGGFLDPWFEFTRLHPCDAFLNIANFCDEELDEMLQIGSTSTDRGERKEAYDRAQEILAEGLEGVYFRENTWAVIMDADLQGYGSWTLPNGEPGFGMEYLTPILVDELWSSGG